LECLLDGGGSETAICRKRWEPQMSEENSSRQSVGWLRGLPNTIKAFVVVPIAGFVFNWFFPGIWETASQRVFGREPVEVAIVDDQQALGLGWSVALPQPLPSEGRPAPGTSGRDVRTRLLEMGAADAGQSNMRMVMRGIGRNATLITGMTARIISRDPIHRGTLVSSRSTGASEVTTIAFNLDATRPLARSFDQVKADVVGEPYFIDNVITIDPDSTFIFDVKALASRATYRWELEIAFQYDGKGDTMTINRNGEPFRTTALSKEYGERFDWAWHESPPHLLAVDEDGSPIDD